MRIFIPKNISGWLFDMNIQLWPLNINMIQFFILAGGIALALTIWNSLVKHWLDKTTSTILVAPIVLIAAFIAFFNVSELSLLPFIAKILRTYFFDTPVKKYTTYKEIDPLEITKYYLRTEKVTKKVDEKKLTLEKDKLKTLEIIS